MDFLVIKFHLIFVIVIYIIRLVSSTCLHMPLLCISLIIFLKSNPNSITVFEYSHLREVIFYCTYMKNRICLIHFSLFNYQNSYFVSVRCVFIHKSEVDSFILEIASLRSLRYES